MKKTVLVSLLSITALMVTGCGKGKEAKKSNGVDSLVSAYGFQWTDPSKPILLFNVVNEQLYESKKLMRSFSETFSLGSLRITT